MKDNKTYFTKGWEWDNTATFTQYYGEKVCAKFIVRLKNINDRFENYVDLNKRFDYEK